MPGEYSYHNASVFLDVVEEAPEPGQRLASGDLFPHDDPRWPKLCGCGYEFRAADEWQLFCEHLFRRQDTGEECTLREAPPGAMWWADWLSRCKGSCYHQARGGGPHLLVQLPGGYPWDVDSVASNGPGWERTGTPPLIVARPSIGRHNKEGGWAYHGFLGGSDGNSPGVLVEC